MIDNSREQLSELSHEQWSGWMRYLFNKGSFNEDGSFTINLASVDRWKRQMNTPYHDLPEDEKESDRVAADKVIALIVKQEIE